MKAGSSGQIVLLAMVVLMGYYVYHPLPAGIQSFHVITSLRLLHDMSWICTQLGIDNSTNMIRILTDGGAMVRFFSYDGVDVEDTVFDDVPVRIYRPHDAVKDNGPGVLFYHGGGWVFGSKETHAHVAETLAIQLSAVVILVGYRLAPDFPYPFPLDDCEKTYIYLQTHASEYGINPRKIAIVGDSAGGNLAAATALRLRQKPDMIQPRLQVLVYPMLQALDFKLPSHLQNSDKVIGNTDILAEIVLHYMGLSHVEISHFSQNRHVTLKTREQYTSALDMNLLPPEMTRDYQASHSTPHNDTLADHVEELLLDPHFMPLMAHNLSGLPETYIVTAEYDMLRDEGIMFAKRLEKAGVPVTWQHYEDGYHGILAFIEHPLKTEIGLSCMDNLSRFIRQKLN